MTDLKTLSTCPRTERPRTDLGCLHCDWSAKLASTWWCMRPWEAGDRERGTCHLVDGACSHCGWRPYQLDSWEWYRCCPHCGRRREDA